MENMINILKSMAPAALFFRNAHTPKTYSPKPGITSTMKQLPQVFRLNPILENLNMEAKIHKILTNNKTLWSATEQVANVIGLTYGEVNRILNNSDKFVSSTNRLQEQVIATRERFRKEEPLIRKLIGAFRYRID